MELQIERIISDITSEKGTRERANSDIHIKLDRLADAQEKTNRILYMLMGGLTALQVVLQFVKH